MPFRLRRKKKEKVGIEEKDVTSILQRELAPYITREELKDYLSQIEKDERKRKLWQSLSLHNKIKVLRYVAGKKGVQNGKK